MPRAVICERIGTWSDVLKLTDISALSPIPADALHVRVTCAGMSFPDLLQVEGKYQQKAEPPFVPVNCIAGVVLAIGADVDSATGWKVGDRVVGSAANGPTGNMCGGLSEEALVRADTATRIPEFMTDEVVLAMHENYWDVHHAISTCGKVGVGDTLLVLGASGACGLAAVDLGKALGAKVVACASSAAKLKVCEAAGADHCVNYEEGGADNFLATLRARKFYGHITAVFDPVGGRYAEAAFRAMAREGRYVVFGFAAGGTDPKSAFPNFPMNVLLMKGQQVIGSMGTSRGEKMDEMFRMVKDGLLKPVVGKVYALDDFAQAFEDMSSRKVVGKVVISPEANTKHARL
jgi:NADPH2:quinone reductase